jgi:nitric-oxide synthase
VRRHTGADREEAAAFITMFTAENPSAPPARARLREVDRSIRRTGTYRHTAEELAWAAKAAWRHAARCTGRSPWRTLRVRDRRHVTSGPGVAAEVTAHLREATNGGRIRSVITVFAPDTPSRRAPRIVSPQVLRYAGYPTPGKVTGDPQNVALTALAARLGWVGAGGRFDLLPLIVDDGTGPAMFPLPADAVLEVPISHPAYSWFAGLGLRWYAVPMISDMILDAGGIRYPCAPFNGWYQASSEIGARDLGDDTRYGMLPAVAEGMGLDTTTLSTLWRDRAVTELAAAVQHSFRAAGVMATDHQTEAARCAVFLAAEEAAGRPCPADWAWIVPPLSGSTTPLFHRTYDSRVVKPGFFHPGTTGPA